MIKKIKFLSFFLFLSLSLELRSDDQFPSDIQASQNRVYINYEEIGQSLAAMYQLSKKDQELLDKQIDEIKAQNRKALEIDPPKSAVEFFKKVFSSTPDVVLPTTHKAQNYEIVSRIMNKVYAYRFDTGFKVSVASLLKDLEFFQNNDGSSDHTFFKAINRTQTIFGEMVLASMLANPLIDSSKLSEQRAFLSYLIKNPNFLDEISKALIALKEKEQKLLKVMGQNRELVESLTSGAGFGKSSLTNLLKNGVGEFSFAGSVGITATFAVLAPVVSFLFHLPKEGSVFVFASLLMAVGNVSSYKQLVSRRNFSKLLHELTVSFNELIIAIESLQNKLKSLPHASKVLKRMGVIEKMTSNQNALKASLQETIFSLKRNPKRFSSGNSGSYWNINAGAAQATFMHLLEAQDDMGELFEAIGEIDAYASIATLATEKASGSAHAFYSLANFVSQEQPKLDLKSFWNPMIPREKVVTNSIHMDADQFHAMVLTGSNTAGKSTLLKSIINTLVMGQGIGLVCAEEATITPFHTIFSSMNISDNIASGDSLFQSEANRAKKIFEIAKTYSKDQKTFILLDEIFTGTGTEKGENAAVSFARNLFKKEGLIIVFATHFKKVTELVGEEDQGVKNYKLDAVKRADGSIFRPFKLEEGISEVNIADEILNQAMGDDGLFFD